jgi:hypothetical protein
MLDASTRRSVRCGLVGLQGQHTGSVDLNRGPFGPRVGADELLTFESGSAPSISGAVENTNES